MRENPSIVEADFGRSDHQEAVLKLLAAYAADFMAGDAPSSSGVGGYVLPHLRDDPKVLTLLAFVKSKAVGIAICFRGFSEAADLPLLIISDFFVLPEHRGHGIGGQMLVSVEDLAHQLDCPRLNLKVKADNHRALRLYEAAGFLRAPAEEGSAGVVSLEKILV